MEIARRASRSTNLYRIRVYLHIEYLLCQHVRASVLVKDFYVFANRRK